MIDLYKRLSVFVEGKDAGKYVVNAVIETPQSCRNKFTYDEKLGLMSLTKVLPAGMVWPFDFGFVPNTIGGDGDPLDVLVLMDEPAFSGCVVAARLIGIIEAEQTERDGTTTRNDRLIAVAIESHLHKEVRSIHDLNDQMVDEIEHFFQTYNEIAGKVFRVIGRYAADKAREVVARSMQ